MPRKGPGYLRQRGKVWYFECMYKGVRYYERIGAVSKTVAVKKASQIYARIVEGTFLPERNVPTFREVAEDYRGWYETHSKAKKRGKHVHIMRINRLIDFFGRYKLDKINWRTVENYKRKRLCEGVSRVTINKELRLLKTIIKRAIDLEMYSGKMPKIELFPDKEKEIVRSLTEEEARKLIEACPEWFKPVVVFALHTGLRAGEIFSLKWEQVDFAEGVIVLEKENTKTKDYYKVFMNETLKNLLLKLKEEQEEKGIEHGYVFVNRFGLPYRYEDKTYRKVFQTACRKAGIKNFRFHDLRHTFASWVAMCSRDIYAVQKLLNHKDLRTTKRYAHLTENYLKKVMSSFPDFGNITAKGEQDNEKEYEPSEREK